MDGNDLIFIASKSKASLSLTQTGFGRLTIGGHRKTHQVTRKCWTKATMWWSLKKMEDKM